MSTSSAITPPESLSDLSTLMPFRTRLADQTLQFVRPPADLDFDRPFWHMTVEGLLEADKQQQLEKVTVTFDQLRRLVGSVTPRSAGMIFHIGRCGSTLLSRMIGHDRRRLLLRESDVLGRLHRSSSGSDPVPTFTIEQAFKDVLVAFDAFADGRNQRPIVKHSSWESFSMGRVAELAAHTPLVFVYRDPVATVESSLEGYPGWGSRLHESPANLARWIPWIERMTPPFTAAELFAAVWASGADAALSLAPERVLVVDHRHMTADPHETLEQVRRHLDLVLDTEAAMAEMGHYSKAKVDGVAFEPKGSHSRAELSARTRERVHEIVGDLPARLERRRLQQSTRDGYHDHVVAQKA